MSNASHQDQRTAPVEVQIRDLRVKKQTIEALLVKKEREIKDLREKDRAIEEIMHDLKERAA